MMKISQEIPDLLTKFEIRQLKDLMNGKEKEYENTRKLNDMKTRLKQRKEKNKKMNFRNRIKKINNELKGDNWSSVILKKMKNFLKIAKSKTPKKALKALVSQKHKNGHDINDFKDFLEEILISGDLKISLNILLATYLKKEGKNIDILIKFITHPFSYNLSHFFIQSHEQL